MHRHKLDWNGLEMVLLRFLCIWCRRLHIIASAFVPICWLMGLLYCLTTVLINRSQLDLPRLHLEGLYNVKEKTALLHILGFIPDPILYPHSHHTGQDLPVFVMTIQSDDLRSFHRFLGNFRLHFSQKKLVVYDLGLTKKELDLVRHTCQCLVRSIHWDRYPLHVQQLSLGAYLPLLIQETLQEFGVVFWCHHTMRFNDSDLATLQSQAEGLGLVAWPAQDYPTSTYTHYGTFRYLGADHTQYHFHRMVEPEMALYCNTYRLHFKLMMPWVQCALDPDCISPYGSQAHSCDLSRRPRYTYAGCHRYDTSAFNVVLGQMFFFDNTYIPARSIFYQEKSLPTSSKRVTAKFHYGEPTGRQLPLVERYLPEPGHRRRLVRTLSPGKS